MVRWIALLLMVSMGVGCRAPDPAPAEFVLEPEDYPLAFDAARETLRDYRFMLDRVDARMGVISTEPKDTAGFATPWDGEQSTLEQEWDDFVNLNARRVRITFEPISRPATEDPRSQVVEGPAPADLRELDEPIVARVLVVEERRARPGWRIDMRSIRHSTFTEDPDLRARRMYPGYTVPTERDVLLEARIAEAILKRLRERGVEPLSPVTASAGG